MATRGIADANCDRDAAPANTSHAQSHICTNLEHPAHHHGLPGSRQRIEETTIFPQPSTPPTLTSIRQTANSARRRSRPGSVLLQSPARPGHSNRMRQIFEHARHVTPAQLHNEDVTLSTLYPQLPNISRRTSPLRTLPREPPAPGLGREPSTSKHEVILGIHCLNRNPAPTSAHSADSWSDDSGYLYTESKIPPSALGSSPQRIKQWLSNVSDDPFVAADGSAEPRLSIRAHGSRMLPLGQSQRHISDVCKKLIFDQEEQVLDTVVITQPPLLRANVGYLQSDSSPSASDARDDHGELASLSPNVCIDRRASRRKIRTDAPGESLFDSTSKSPTAFPAAKENENSSSKHVQQRTTLWHTPDQARTIKRLWDPKRR